MDFTELFRPVSPEKFAETFNIFNLTGADFYLVSAGTNNNYNSMIGSGGGFGFFFKNPTNWSLFRQDRYTLELIEKYKKYSISFFPEKYKNEILFLGQESGRNSNKMKKCRLTPIKTPSQNIVFKEALLIIECELTSIIIPDLNNFYSDTSIKYIKEVYKNKNEFRKIVFGEITNIWINN